MLLTAATDIPLNNDWIYEAKYDGFRCLLEWEVNKLTLKSRNGKVLNEKFPELIQFFREINDLVSPFLPLTLDGELVYLTNDFQSDFSTVQKRGRMRNSDVIMKHAQDFPCHYIVFDILMYSGEEQTNHSLIKRKKKLQKLFQSANLPLSTNYEDIRRMQAIDIYEDSKHLWEKIVAHNGEGIIAKQKNSNWESDKRTTHWLKIKNWRYVSVILMKYDQNNGFFHGAVYQGDGLIEVVTFRHGLKEDELTTLSILFQSNGKLVTKNVWELEPSICVTVACISFDGKLREPRFHAFELGKDPQECNWREVQRQLYPLPETVQVTHSDKPLWQNILKDDYLLYLQLIAPYLLPFLSERLLTVIRYPHGSLKNERFFQKHCPDYAPDLVTTELVDDINYIVCNNIETLLWLGNQLALEFHIPFQTRATNNPTEIVFDLDPPSVNEFSLAIEAALRMKAIFDEFQLKSFVKTSGGKGLQLYIPLPNNSYTYDDTRIFTEFVCRFLCEQEPNLFTTERLKKNRNNRLYLDYVQHSAGKTIIAPYSTRGNKQGLVATPLNWNEMNDSLKPDLFTIVTVIERIKTTGDPFRHLREIIEQPFDNVLSQLKDIQASRL